MISLPQNSPTKNLILSFATNAQFSDIARFLISARSFCSPQTTDIVLFVEPKAVSFSQLARELNIFLVPVHSHWKAVSDNLILKILSRGFLTSLRWAISQQPSLDHQVYRAAIINWIHVIPCRHFVYRDFLSANSHYRCVLLSDSRDVFFQDDPFSEVNPNILNVFEQDCSLSYGLNNLDTEWFASLYGEQLLQSIQGKIAICAGTTIGSPTVLLNYLSLMEKEILAYHSKAIDQPIHNKIIYLDLPANTTKIHGNLSGLIYTIGHTSESNFSIKNNQIIVNEKVVPILHQYDRNPKIKNHVETLYPLAKD